MNLHQRSTTAAVLVAATLLAGCATSREAGFHDSMNEQGACAPAATARGEDPDSIDNVLAAFSRAPKSAINTLVKRLEPARAD